MMKCRICGSDSKLIYENLFDDRHGYEGKFSEYKCTKCGFIQIDPMLSISEISKVYEEYYPVASLKIKNAQKFAKVPNRFSIWFQGIDNLPHFNIEGKNKDILDYGAGSGKHMLKIINDHNVEGIDPDPKAAEEAKRLNLKVYTGFTKDIPKEKKYDYILLAQVLEHEPDPKKLITELSEHLKQDGQMILAFPHGDSIYRKFYGKKWIHWHVPYHINLFNKKSVEELVKDTPLKLKKFKTISPNEWSSLQLYRLFSNVKEGMVDTVWGTTKRADKFMKRSGLIKPILGFGRINFSQFFLNRFVDLFGMGDCCLIVLSK